MADNDQLPRMPAGSAVFGEVQKNWGWLLALGIVFVLLGTIGLGMTFFLTMAGVLYFGVLMLIGGAIQIFHIPKARAWKSTMLSVLIAALYLLAGVIIIANPLEASAILTLVIAGALVAVGVVRILIALQHRGSNGWGWALLSGITSIVLGGVIAAGWPVSGLWVIGLFVAIELILNGWSCIVLALAARNAPGTATSNEGSAPAPG